MDNSVIYRIGDRDKKNSELDHNANNEDAVINTEIHYNLGEKEMSSSIVKNQSNNMDEDNCFEMNDVTTSSIVKDQGSMDGDNDIENNDAATRAPVTHPSSSSTKHVTADKNGSDSTFIEADHISSNNHTVQTYDDSIRELISALKKLQVCIDEVIAEPSAINFKKLHHQGSSAHRLYNQLGKVIELGKTQDGDEKREPLTVDDATRNQLASFGMNMWLNVQNSPECFIDAIAASSSSYRSGAVPQDRELELEKERAAASGYIRSLSCRLTLVSKFRTRGLRIPRLIEAVKEIEKGGENTAFSNSSSITIATTGELEFAFKCLCRAGRAILNYSLSQDLSSLPESCDSSAAYSTLSLALEVWRGIERVQLIHRDRGKRCLFIEEAFEAMICLADCATFVVGNDSNYGRDHDINEACEKVNIEALTTVSVLDALKRIEEFVGNQVSLGQSNVDSDLKMIQYYLPSLARTSYKHGNRFARQSTFDASREALRIALCSTDKCLAMIKQKLEEGGKNNSDRTKRSLQVQEQEMFVLSKQSFYVLCHVWKSLGKTNEARKCLDRIELYIDEQMKKDSDQYKEAMKSITKFDANETNSLGNISGFAMEGPKKQDIAEIKARLLAAKTKSKHCEIMERINLAYSRIMVFDSNSVGSDMVEEKKIDTHFQLMIKLILDIESYHGAKSNDPILVDKYDSPHKERDAFELVLSAARRIFMRRRDVNSLNDQFQDPYLALFTMYPKGKKKFMFIQLEFLSTLLILSRDMDGKQNRRHGDTDERALDIGKQLVSQLTTMINETSSKKLGRQDDSTLFFENKGIRTLEIESLLNDAKEHFTRAISLYYSSQSDYDKAVEWCNLLIDIMRLLQQFSYVHNNEGGVDVERDRYEHVVSGILSTKALSLSMTNCHGAALKIAREAWEKCGADVRNLVTLFHCSVQYEAFSDSEGERAFDNSLLELDNAISNFLSLSKISKINESSQDKLLQSFPVMCNTAMQIEKTKALPVVIGLQRRYIDFFVAFAREKVATYSQNVAWNNDEQTIMIPGENNLFSILCSYLGNIDTMLTSLDLNFHPNWYFKQLQSLLNTLDKVLQLLTMLRDHDCENKNSQDNLLKFAETFKEEQHASLDDEPVILLERKIASQLIGSSASCLWIGEQLWNIATAIVSKEPSSCINEKSSWRLHAANLYSKAHDFALLSEEEYNAFLTKGFLACENFDGKQYKDKAIDFVSKTTTLSSTDICSEFSAQCLLLHVAHVLDYHMEYIYSSLTDTQDIIVSSTATEQSHLLSTAMNCLIATMSEIHVLDTDTNHDIDQQLKFLALTLLIALQDDEYCCNILTKCGLLNQIELSFMNGAPISTHNVTNNENDERPSNFSNINDLFNRFYYQLIPLTENFGMNETTKILLKICAKCIMNNSYHHDMEHCSLGLIQRKIIHLSSRVEEVVNVFISINEQVKKSFDSNINTNANANINKTTTTTKNDENDFTDHNNNNDHKIHYYKQQDIDYFVIEAHNRAINLLYIGDYHNSEKLLTVALNLLPYCGKEVECHGSEIRKVYRGVIQRRSYQDNDYYLGVYDNIVGGVSISSLFEGR